MLVCGEPTVDGAVTRSYCACHLAEAYQPGSAKPIKPRLNAIVKPAPTEGDPVEVPELFEAAT